MTMDVTAQTSIDADRDRVASYAMDPNNDPVWISGISEAEMITPPPLQVGSQVRRVAHFLGRRIDYVLEVVALDPDRRIAMRSVKAPFPMEVEYEFETEGDATRARIHIGGDAGVMYRVAGPILSRSVKRSISKDLRNLKRIIESQKSIR